MLTESVKSVGSLNTKTQRRIVALNPSEWLPAEMQTCKERTRTVVPIKTANRNQWVANNSGQNTVYNVRK